MTLNTGNTFKDPQTMLVAEHDSNANQGLNVVASAERDLDEMLKQREDLNRRIPTIARFINSRRPISRLPVELLVKTFSLVHDRPEYDYILDHRTQSIEYDPPWFPMLAVCHHWRMVVLGTPMLWWLVHAAPWTTFEGFTTVLSRSGSRSIDVILEKIDKIELFTYALFPHLSRITTLHIRDTDRDDAAAFYRIANRPLLAMHKLQIWLDGEDEEDGGGGGEEPEIFTVELKPDHLPRLSELSLRRVGLRGLPWNTDWPLLLTRLELRDSTSPGCYLSDFMFLLQKCHNLEDLTLVRFRPWERNFDVFTDPATRDELPLVEFTPKLQQLVVEDLDVYTARLLSGFSVPVSTNVFVIKLISSCDHHEQRPYEELFEGLFDSCLPIDRSRFPILQQVDRAHVQQSRSSVYAVARAGQTTFSIGVKVRPYSIMVPHDLLQGAVSFLGASPLVELCIYGIDRIGHSDGEWESALRTFSQLKKLAVLVRKSPFTRMNYDNLLSALKTADDGGDDAAKTPLCSNLEELHLTVPPSEDAFDALRNALVARQSQSARRLKSLYLKLGRAREVSVPSTSPGTLEDVEKAAHSRLRSCADVVHPSHERYPHDLSDGVASVRLLMEEL